MPAADAVTRKELAAAGSGEADDVLDVRRRGGERADRHRAQRSVASGEREPARHTAAELEALREKFRGQPFEVIAVNVDHDAAAARAFLERVGVHYPVAFDRDGLQLHARVPNQADLDALPVGMLLDGRGVIRLTHRGYAAGQSAFLSEHIETLLAELRIESDARH